MVPIKNIPLICLIFSVIACVLEMNASVCAQSNLATIVGPAPDARATPLTEKAAVIQTNLENCIEPAVQTKEDGIYHFADFGPGNYEFSVPKRGFKVSLKPGVTLHVADTISMNFNMQVGDVKETVTVEAGAPPIKTESAFVSTVVDRQFAENFPMNGRSVQTLIQLTPGVVLTTSSATDNGQFSVNGQRAASNYWMVDGVSANVGIGPSETPAGNGFSGANADFCVLGGTNSLVSVDTLQDFRIQASTFAPEFGRSVGGQISIVSRLGTNQWHGSTFDYLRNDVFDATDWFGNSAELAKPRERQNDSGHTLSGPVLKNRTFFFFSYEGLWLRLPLTTLTTLPDATFTPGSTTKSRQDAVAVMQILFLFRARPLTIENCRQGWTCNTSFEEAEVRC